MNKTNAQHYWRNFEKFVLAYLKDKYGITDNKFAILTPPSGDGGFDGVLYLHDLSLAFPLGEILFEAKLRSAIGTSLEMNQFSKSLIIAVNRFANAIYIATNLSFSENTRLQLAKFGKHLDMEIHLLDGKELYAWYNSKDEDFQHNTQFDPDFITFLQQSAAKIHESPKRTLVEQPNNFQSSPSEDYIPGSKDRLKERILQDIYTLQHGLFLLKGAPGCGKSFLSSILVDELKSHGYESIDIDMNMFDSSRAIFLKFLEWIWGIRPEGIFKGSDKDLETVFQVIGQDPATSDQLECLKFIFSQDAQNYKKHSDTYHSCLLDILETLFAHYSKKIPYCVHIHNLDSAHEESISFLDKLIHKLNTSNIVFLVEIPEPFDSRVELSLNKWKIFLNKLDSLSDSSFSYTISPFSEGEKQIYISKILPHLKKQLVTTLAHKLPENPLHLHTATKLMEKQLQDNEYFLPEEIEKEIRYFNKAHSIQIVSTFIQHLFYDNPNEPLVSIFSAMGLLNGECSLKNLALIVSEIQNSMFDFLLSTGLFRIEDNVLKITHTMYLSAIQEKFMRENLRTTQEVAEAILNCLPQFARDETERSILYIKSANVLGKYPELLKECLKTGYLLSRQGDYQKASDILEIAYSNLDDRKLIDNCFLGQKLAILERLIFIKWETTGGSDSTMEKYIARLRWYIELCEQESLDSIELSQAKVCDILFDMKKMHIQSRHAECLKRACDAEKICLDCNAKLHFPKVMEQVLWLKCLSIKHVYGMEKSLNAFAQYLKQYPDMHVLEYSYNTHCAAKLSGTNSSDALECFQKNIALYSEISMADQLHNRTNISNMKFFLHKYQEAEEEAKSIIADALLYDVDVELGRAYNTLGNCYSVRNDISNAKISYQKAIALFERTENTIHLWPPLVNKAFLCIHEKEDDEAVKLLNNAVKIFIKRKAELKNSEEYHVAKANKLLIGVCIVLYLLRIFSERNIQAKAEFDYFSDTIKSLIPSELESVYLNDDEFYKYFKDSVYDHCGKILLKL